ncbi:MAG: two pore domain potassium channel family protein [Burkholderiales bacterium]|nr:two pore domain potassium channel family protein [Burkholderiales bacterium]
MAHTPLAWIGLAGISPDDNARARAWQQRLHWSMVGVALLSVPAYLLSTSELHPLWHTTAALLDLAILVAFLGELAWMMWLSSHPIRYLLENWLNVIIVLGAAAAVLGAATEWIAVVRAMRAAVAVLVVVRTATEFRVLFTRRGAPMLVGVAVLTVLLLGALFFWLDPRIHSFADGLWLTFITGATVGYGDIVPSTNATRLLAALTVLVGVALMTLFTGNVVAFFLGGEETRAREALQRDLVALRDEIHALLDAHEARRSAELIDELRRLRGEIDGLRAQLHALSAPAARDPPP